MPQPSPFVLDLSRATDFFGPLDWASREIITAYAARPSAHGWDAVKGMTIEGTGLLTLEKAVSEVFPEQAAAGCPSALQIQQAIDYATR